MDEVLAPLLWFQYRMYFTHRVRVAQQLRPLGEGAALRGARSNSDGLLRGARSNSAPQRPLGMGCSECVATPTLREGLLFHTTTSSKESFTRFSSE